MNTCNCGCGKPVQPGFLGYTSACYQRIRKTEGHIETHCIDCDATITEAVNQGRRSKRCETCKIHYRREWAAQHQRETRRLYKFGVTIEECEAILKKQKYACAICGKKLRPWKTTAEGDGGNTHLDHDHNTGKIRGALCNSCNMGLGNLRDSIDILQKAIDYLRKYQD